MKRERSIGAYIKGTNALAFDQEAQRLRMKFGWEGWGVYVGLLCLLVNQPDGSLDVSDGDAWAVLALQMGCPESLLETIVPCLAERGLADARALGDGRLQMPGVRPRAGVLRQGRARRQGLRRGEAAQGRRGRGMNGVRTSLERCSNKKERKKVIEAAARVPHETRDAAERETHK